MKKRILYHVGTMMVLTWILGSVELKAQSNWEIGARFGPDIAIDMTIPLARAPRLHPAIYVHHDFAVGAYFDWLFAFEGGATGFKLYPGVGPEFYFYDGFDFGIAGDFGLEYSFDFPLTIGIDWRPGFMVTEGFEFYNNNWGIFARFRFGEGVRLVKAH